MSAMDHSTLLTKLIIACEASLQLRHGLNREALCELAGAIGHESAAPTDVARVMTEEVVMCADAVVIADGHLRSYARHKARPFLQVIGVLLPEVRHALTLALEQRKRPTP